MYIIPATACAPSNTPPQRQPFKISQLTTATNRIAELTKTHPGWPQSRVRAQVARELDISTVQLRYLLSKAADS
jgi:hypothetical protein